MTLCVFYFSYYILFLNKKINAPIKNQFFKFFLVFNSKAIKGFY